MSTFFSDAISYGRAVFADASVLVFTAFDVIGAIILLSPRFTETNRISDETLQSLGILILLLSFLTANFTAYRNLLQKTRLKVGDLDIKIKSCDWQVSGAVGGIPSNPIRFGVELDCRNNGDEDVIVNSVKISEFSLNSPFIINEPYSIEWYREYVRPQQKHIRITFPQVFEKQSWGDKLIVNMSFNINTDDGKAIAQYLRRKDEYSFCLEFEYHSSDGIVKTKKVCAKETLEQYQIYMVKFWRDHKRHDLAWLALDIDSAIDLQEKQQARRRE